MESNRLRQTFTDFFVDRGHVAVPSAGLIPHHPRAPFFTNAGMNQFIPYLLGEERAPWPRAVTVQKCVRIRGKHDDIDLTGRTRRHLTFFEMLGNFSFGDYFKKDAISYAWELMTEVLGLDHERLWVTVHNDDDEAASIWRDHIGIPEGRVQRMGEDNFWEMGDTGPCGPSSEIYFDTGPEWGRGGGPTNGSEDRFIEFWNLVFTEFNRNAAGELEPLPSKNIDTGAGFERLLAFLQGVSSIWETDVLRSMIAHAENLTGRAYGREEEVDVALRILADHARSMTFLISDGVFPSNEDRGYVLRRLIRRAVRLAYQMGVETPVTPGLVKATVKEMGQAYPEIERSSDFVTEVVAKEESRFRTTLKAGLSLLEAELESGTDRVDGRVAFRLHDTHGFPVELTREIAGERGLDVDEGGFEQAMQAQRQMSRRSAEPGSATADRTEEYRSIVDKDGPTEFVGYTERAVTATIQRVLPAPEEARYEVFLDVTPFYAEGGGQVGDTGSLESDSGRGKVLDTTAPLPGLHMHLVEMETGELHEGQTVTAEIDSERRDEIMRNHTGTHLLHAALREVLGDHVKQQGSLVAPDRLRFDFTHYAPLQPQEIARVEDLVNSHVLSDEPVITTEMPKVEADAEGAIAFFQDRYGEEVRVVRAGGRSVELCGGTHVSRLGQIGPMEIVAEGSIGSNIRRLEATTGTGTLARMRQTGRALSEAASLLRSTPNEVPGALERKLNELKTVQARLSAARQAALDVSAGEIAGRAVDGILVTRRDGMSGEDLRQLAVSVSSQEGVDVAVLGGSPDGRAASLVVSVPKGYRVTAPDLISGPARTIGGGGGGRNPELAVAGGKNPAGIDRALEEVRSTLGGRT